MKNLHLWIICSGFLLLTSINVQAQNQNNFEISKSLDIYTSLLRELNLSYVDEINPAELNEIAIKSMLEDLDPYTVFVPEAEIENFQLMTTGEYGGIGSLIQLIDGKVTITEPYEGFPAQKSGLIPGDAILEINGVDASGKNTSAISELLKGQPGSPIELKIKREGFDIPLSKTLIREKIKIDNIPYHTVFENGIGYLLLTGFTQKAASEMKEILLQMKEDHDLKGFILDLRSNGGGLLNEAVDICNLFVDKGELIVSMRGKTAEKTTVHRTRQAPVDKSLPIIVLVNEASASASEIVAGALQDLDRAVIIGQRTFGKGLVQNVVPLSYNTQMKVTVAKYYIPSGRCIQEVDYSHKTKTDTTKRDSLVSTFKTRNGRLVYDGKGIAPDVPLDAQTYSAVTANLYAGNYIFKFANQFAQKHKSIAKTEDFEITEEIYTDFLNYLEENNFSYITESERMIENMRRIADQEAYKDAIETQLHALEEQLTTYKKNDLQKHRGEIEELLKMEIVQRYYYQKGKIISALQDDPELQTAFDILLDESRYQQILSPEQ
ncbi:MAG: S41 family peptidase [Bacteroidales bacterium]|jgi:carboxyl-terminal processing protease|nr:S41 family peptidase [Bacteroidales bacterium]